VWPTGASLSETKRRVFLHFDTDFVEDGRAKFPEVEFISVPRTGPLPDGVTGEALLTFAWGTENLAEVVERGVQWVHTIGTGVDRFPMDAIGDRILTCARGASAVPIAEWTLAMMLAFEKNLPDSWSKDVPEQWNMATLGGLDGKTLGLVGLGSIGEAIAKRAEVFGMKIVATRRSNAPSALSCVEVVPKLEDVLAQADHIVVAAAATPETNKLIDANALAHCKPGAHLVNIARGSIVDQDAVRSALDRGQLARASLDVCEPEPLPEGHWLYTHPKVFLSPHISWAAPGALDGIRATFYRNLRRYLDGDPLEAVVDRVRGY
jgi:phosphoglycerate dehydrogenase-like enzyme